MKLSPDQIIVDAIQHYYQGTAQSDSGNENRDNRACWFIDDNASPEALNQIAQLAKQESNLLLVTNRFDKFLTLENQLLKSDQIRFNDFDLSDEKSPLNTVFFRVAKEKPLNLYWINQAFERLAVNGKLVFVGNKNDGVKSIIKHAENRFNTKAKLTKHKPDAILATLEKLQEQHTNTPLDDRNYTELRSIGSQNAIAETPVSKMDFYSKPGVFGWDKIDQGSQLLVDGLSTFLHSVKTKPKRMLDLGCGYGYITAMAAQLNEFDEIVATDNNATALLAAEKTFAENGINAKCMATDAGEQITKPFDLILCNPPFHQGFSVDGGLTQKFLANTKRLLSKDGHAIYVVNAFIGVEKLANQIGLHTRLITDNKQFKVIELKF